MKNFSVWIFTLVPLIAAITLAADLLPNHGIDETWPNHAKFHATWAAAKFLALGVIVALVAQNALKSQETWAWWVMAVYLVVGFGGQLPAVLWHGDGPPMKALMMIGVLVLLMFVALVGSAREIFSKHTQNEKIKPI